MYGMVKLSMEIDTDTRSNVRCYIALGMRQWISLQQMIIIVFSNIVIGGITVIVVVAYACGEKGSNQIIIGKSLIDNCI